MKVIAFGEILWDVYADEACLGGAPLNFAAHLARHGHEVYMLSAVGVDELGDRALAQVQAWGVHTEYVARLTTHRTGACMVTLNEAGVPHYDLLTDVAYDHIPAAAPAEADVLYFGTLALRGEENRRTLQQVLDTVAFKDVFVDVNIRAPFYEEASVRLAVEHATVLKISDEELQTVAKLLAMPLGDEVAFMKALTAAYPLLQCVILTRGSKGAYVYRRGDEAVHESACKGSKVVSTVGAGDSFSAAFLHMYGAGKSSEECASHAATVAGFVVSRREAVPPYDPQTLTVE